MRSGACTRSAKPAGNPCFQLAELRDTQARESVSTALGKSETKAVAARGVGFHFFPAAKRTKWPSSQAVGHHPVFQLVLETRHTGNGCTQGRERKVVHVVNITVERRRTPPRLRPAQKQGEQTTRQSMSGSKANAEKTCMTFSREQMAKERRGRPYISDTPAKV